MPLIKRKKKTKSPKSGRHIPADVYTALYTSYAENRDVKQAAKDAGVTVRVAKKYIELGTNTLPAISERIMELDQRTLGSLDADILEARQNTMDVVSGMSRKLVDSLKSVEIVLSSSRLYDENGDERTTADGKPIVPLDANGVRSVLQAARDITDLLGMLGGPNTKDGGAGNSPTVNVGISLSPEGVRAAAGKVMRRIVSDPTAEDAGVIEGKFQEAAVEEATKRVNEAYAP